MATITCSGAMLLALGALLQLALTPSGVVATEEGQKELVPDFVMEKRFKASPFAWTNTLSGYKILLVHMPDELGQEGDNQKMLRQPYSGKRPQFDSPPSKGFGDDAHYQMQIVRSQKSPGRNKERMNAPLRSLYVIKWLNALRRNRSRRFRN